MCILPNAKNAVIPIEKLTKYSLNKDKDPDKAFAFRSALGYTPKNAERLIENVHGNIRTCEAVFKGNNGFGKVYECILNIVGENGKTANVLTSWIVENGTDYPRLTSIYVTKKSVR